MANDVTAILLFSAVFGLCAFLIWIFIDSENSRNRRLRDAKAAYEESLSQLKNFPTNPDLKQQTLALGRAYSNITREQKGVTIYDEVALSNDISAACAAASVQQSAALPEAQAIQPKELRLGMTLAQIEAALGLPETRADLGEKVLYKYRNMTVEFHDGKVTDVH